MLASQINYFLNNYKKKTEINIIKISNAQNHTNIKQVTNRKSK